MSRSTLSRHKSHIINVLQRAAVSREKVTAAAVMGRFETLMERATKLLDASEKDKNYRSAIAAVRTLHDLNVSVADLAGVKKGPEQPAIVGATFRLFKEESENAIEEAGPRRVTAA